jgi:transcription antitermination factor NusG
VRNHEQHSYNWKVVYVAPRAEKKVSKRLTQLGIDNYVPLKREKRQWSDRQKWVEFPLISGYVFVRPNNANRELVFKAEGILNFVRSNGKDAEVTVREIQVLQMIEEKGYYVEGHFERLSVGDYTEIIEGPFKGLKGIITEMSDEKKFQILIESIDFHLTIKLTPELIKRIV